MPFKNRRIISVIIIAFFSTIWCSAQARAQTQADIQVGFSPSGNAEELIIKCIDEAHREIKVLAYIFTSNRIGSALMRAKTRGVVVQMIVDPIVNRSKPNRIVLERLQKNGVTVFANHKNQSMHDKVMIIDRNIVQTGSYNYTVSARISNSENIIIVKGEKNVTAAYLDHWNKLSRPANPYNFHK